MANRFWVGGTATWDGTAGSKWATTSGGAGGQTVPTAGDDVFFDGNSGANTITIGVNTASCHSLDMTGFTGTLACSGTRTLNIGGGATLTTAAVFKLGSGMTFSGGGTFTVQLDNRSGGITVTSNGITMNGLSVFNVNGDNASAALTTFSDTTNAGSAAVHILRSTAVTFSANFTTSGSIILDGLASTSETVTYTGVTLTCNSWSYTSSGTYTFTGNSSSNITCTGASGSFAGNGKSYPGTVTLNGGGNTSITGANTFVNLTLTGTAVTTDNCSIAANQTITGVFTATGNAANKRMRVISNTFGTARTMTITGATCAFTDADFRDMNFSGSTTSGTRVGDMGGNTNLTSTTPKTSYVSGVGSNQNWNATIWASSSNGSPADTNYPLPQDTCILDTNSFTANSIVLSMNDPHVGIIDSSAATNHNHTLSGSGTAANINLYGNVTLGSQTTWTQASGVNFFTNKRGTQTFTVGGGTLTPVTPTQWNIQNIGGTFQPQDDFDWSTNSILSGVILLNGTFNPLGNFKISLLNDSGTATKAFTGTTGKTLTLTGTGSIYSLAGTGTTNTPNSVNIAVTDVSATNKTFAGNGGTYGDFIVSNTGSGQVILTGANTFNSMSMTGVGTKTIVFPSSTTTTLTTAKFFAGTSGNIITIQSSTGGTAGTLACSAGTVVTNFVSLKDSTASGATPFFAGSGSTNVSGNTNWNFTDLAWDMIFPTKRFILQSVNRAGTY